MGILIGIAIDTQTASSGVDMLTALTVPVHKHGAVLLWYVSPSVSFSSVLQFSEYKSLIFVTTFIRNAAAAAAKSLQSCPTLCDPTDGSPPGSPVPEILQARTLEWVAIPFSNAWKWKVKVKLLSRIQL